MKPERRTALVVAIIFILLAIIWFVLFREVPEEPNPFTFASGIGG